MSVGLIDANAALALVERSLFGGLEVTTSRSRLDLVKEIMSTGQIGRVFGGICYGCDAHIRALDEIQAALEATRHAILKHNAEQEES